MFFNVSRAKACVFTISYKIMFCRMLFQEWGIMTISVHEIRSMFIHISWAKASVVTISDKIMFRRMLFQEWGIMTIAVHETRLHVY